eukprot:CAMPEP_0195122570 /NCGR_PEP_ID=MMETSP0448-20130528/126709_1 /TAXON_ID=66468 /ORGANISM="Heterocapsa triquestra, Strain CCMP 448" /LENGTH=132 /DNA_ID=CAMNT_0040160065 /DNA_START=1 /DNA_END=395 /DNA_ORIENTATION=+
MGPGSRPSSSLGTAPAANQVMKLIHRSTRTLPSGQPVVLSIVREAVPDSYLHMRVLLYHPLTACEQYVHIETRLLDKVLRVCGLGDSKTVTAEAVDASAKEVAAKLLPCVYVHPEGTEVEIRGEAPPQPALT